jgi:hypothetical protein
MTSTLTLVDRFVGAVRRRPAKHTIDDTTYLEMLWRMVRALELRAIDNPELLPQVVELAKRLSEVVNVAIAGNAERYAVDERLGASAAECGRILGTSKQAANKRAARGREVMEARLAAASVPRIGRHSVEAAREREAIAAAADYAVTVLADWRARKAA